MGSGAVKRVTQRVTVSLWLCWLAVMFRVICRFHFTSTKIYSLAEENAVCKFRISLLMSFCMLLREDTFKAWLFYLLKGVIYRATCSFVYAVVHDSSLILHHHKLAFDWASFLWRCAALFMQSWKDLQLVILAKAPAVCFNQILGGFTGC